MLRIHSTGRHSSGERPFRQPWHLLAAALVVGVAGCSSPNPATELRNGLHLRIQSDKKTYQAGDLVRVTISNSGNDTAYVDPCAFQLEGQVREGFWSSSFGYGGCVLTGDDPPRQLVSIPPGARWTDDLPLSARAYRAPWRVHLRFLDRRGSFRTRTPSHSNEFFVEGVFEADQLPEFRWVLSGTDSAEAFIRSERLRHDRF